MRDWEAVERRLLDKIDALPLAIYIGSLGSWP